MTQAISVHGVPRVRAERKRHKPAKACDAEAKRRTRRRRLSNAELLQRQDEQWR